MSKKDFVAIAKTFKAQMSNPTVPAESRVTLIALANTQADYFESIAPAFDRERFLKAAGVA